MPRITRTASQAQTRALLLASAHELFLRDGYNPTGITAITEHAGFTTGAFYSNFANKAAVALEVLRTVQAERTEELAAIVNSRSADLTAKVESWAEQVLQSGWPRLELEFALTVRGNTELVKEESNRNRGSVAFIAESIEKGLSKNATAALPVKQIAEAVMNLAFGVAVRRIIDPKVSLTPLTELTQLAESYLSTFARGHGKEL